MITNGVDLCMLFILDLPKALQPKHLLWMCNQIEEHAENDPATKLHRWIGFVQCAMMAHRMLDLDGAKAMFAKAKVAHGDISEDLLDHLDPTISYEVDIGGEGSQVMDMPHGGAPVAAVL